jgi:hypothetical protein
MCVSRKFHLKVIFTPLRARITGRFRRRAPDPSPVTQKPAELDRTVRVTAAKIERLMGQAGEVVVGAGWLPTFSESLLELKRNHLELLNLLEGLQDAVMQKKKQTGAGIGFAGPGEDQSLYPSAGGPIESV